MTERRLRAGTQIFIGAPAKEPSAEIVAAVERGTDPFPEVSAFYLFQLATVEESNLVVGIELTDPSRETVAMPAVGEAIGAQLPRGEAIDVLHLSGGLLGDVAGYVPRHARQAR
jgi:hypothetical protein